MRLSPKRSSQSDRRPAPCSSSIVASWEESLITRSDDQVYGVIQRCVSARIFCYFLQRVSIACYAERCISHSKSVRPSVRLSVTRWH